MRRLLGVLLLWCIALPSAGAPRVVTLAPHLAELVCAVGACTQLVGVTRYTDEPGARNVQVIGDAFALNLEAIVAARPDLVLAWEGGTSPQLAQRIASLGLPLHWVRVQRLDDIAVALADIGQRVGQGSRGLEQAAAFRAQLNALQQQYAGRQPLRVFYQLEVQPMYTISGRSPMSEAITLCGGVNIFHQLPQIAAAVSVESVLAARPEVIVFAREDHVRQIRRFWQRWPQVPAVARDQLYDVEASLLARQSPRVLEGIAELCRVLDQARADRLSRAAR